MPEPIKTMFEDSNFTYKQIERCGDIAIYTQTHKLSGVERYEVIRIRVRPAHVWPDGVETPEKEGYPGSNAWGKDGWTFFTLAEAKLWALSRLAPNAAPLV